MAVVNRYVISGWISGNILNYFIHLRAINSNDTFPSNLLKEKFAPQSFLIECGQIVTVNKVT